MIAVLTTIWERPELTRVWLEYFNELADEKGLVIVPVFSNDEDPSNHRNHEYANKELINVQAVDHANDPLTEKWNAGLMYCAGFTDEIEGVLILGSDNFVGPAYFDRIRELLEQGQGDYIVPNGWTICELNRKQIAWLVADGVGAGRFLSTDLLERHDWRGWHGKSHHSPDKRMDIEMAKEEVTRLDVNPMNDPSMTLIDFKYEGTRRRDYDRYVKNLKGHIIGRSDQRVLRPLFDDRYFQLFTNWSERLHSRTTGMLESTTTEGEPDATLDVE